MKNTSGKTKILLVICIILMAVALASCSNRQESDPQGSQWALRVGDISITQAEYDFYLSDFTHHIFEVYFHRLGVSPFSLVEPLEEQMYIDGEQTWSEYIQSLIVEVIIQYAEARETGLYLTEEELEFLEEYKEWLQMLAEFQEQTADELISGYYEGLTLELFMRIIERDMIIDKWRTLQIENMSFSQEEMKEFYYNNWQEIDPHNNGVRNTDVFSVDARHILVMFPSNATPDEIAVARQTAENLLAEWKNGEATEASFAILATERTEDPGSIDTGGLYTNIRQGDMVPAFDAWIFDDNRSFGDTDIVETNFGFHIMFFVQTNVDWEIRTEIALTDRAFAEIKSELLGRFAVEKRAA